MTMDETNFITEKQLAWLNDFMANALEVTPDDEALAFLVRTIGLSTTQAGRVMGYRQEFLTRPEFELTLSELS